MIGGAAAAAAAVARRMAGGGSGGGSHEEGDDEEEEAVHWEDVDVDDESDDSDAEDDELKPSDALFVAARTEEDFSCFEMHARGCRVGGIATISFRSLELKTLNSRARFWGASRKTQNAQCVL